MACYARFRRFESQTALTWRPVRARPAARKGRLEELGCFGSRHVAHVLAMKAATWAPQSGLEVRPKAAP